MTLVQEAAAPRLDVARRSRAPRLIAVGVRDASADDAVLRWAATEAVPGDVLHVVHAFVPLRLDRCQWDPVRRERDHRALAARRAVAQAQQRARTMRVDLEVGGSAVAGLPDDVLIEFSQVVDLLVIGDDSAEPRGGLRVAWRVPDLAACPVVCVPPAGARFDAPVTVVLDERGLVPRTLRFALEWAQRHDVNVRVLRPWSPLHDEAVSAPTWLAHRAEQLDTQLVDWQVCYPHVGMVASIETADDWEVRARADSSLLVTTAGAPASVVSADGEPTQCATAVVPA